MDERSPGPLDAVFSAKDGRVRHYRLVAEPMQEALSWIAQYGRFWDAQFDSLDRYLREQSSEGQR